MYSPYKFCLRDIVSANLRARSCPFNVIHVVTTPPSAPIRDPERAAKTDKYALFMCSRAPRGGRKN